MTDIREIAAIIAETPVVETAENQVEKDNKSDQEEII